MKSIFDLATPRSKVLQGELSEDLFAARLQDVTQGKGEDVYSDPGRFFDNTYSTAGLQTLMQEVLGRLTGQAPASNPIIRLETSFGGGKTHNLIALYHMVSGRASAEQIRHFVDEDWALPGQGDIDVAGIVGSDLDPVTGIRHPDDQITTYTLWGELAYQVGGRAGYALARDSDEKKIAPGTGLFTDLIGDKPTLIMIDEIARHLRTAVATPTATGQSNLAEQTVAFLMSLMEYVSSQKHVVLVLTLAGEADAFQKETEQVRQAIAESLKVSARQERVLTPAGENEISAIVVHRLFEHVDYKSAGDTVSRYGAYYQELSAQNASLHERALRAEYLEEFNTAYPFHPELIRVLTLKVATVPNFQRTRGALRLLARVVRRLWETHPSNTWLIHTHHVALDQSNIIEDLTSRLDRPRFKQVCEADIVSPQIGIPAHADEVDKPMLASGKPPYARRLGTTIFLHSLTQGVATGVEVPELMLAVLTPITSGGDDPGVVGRALERLHDIAWFMEYDGFRYRFKTEPSINKIIKDEMDLVGPSRAKREIDERIERIWKSGFLKPKYFPTSPADLEDDAGTPKLAIMHYDAVSLTAADTGPPDMVRKLFEYKGITEAFRGYRNNLLFLVADKEQVEQMVEVSRRYLAINRITSSAERMREFNEDYQKKLRKMGEATELDVRVAITKAYRYLFYPSGDAPASQANLRRETLPPQSQGETKQDQTNVVINLLHSLKKIRKADDTPLSGAYVKAKAWDLNQVEMTTEGLRRAFARKVSLPIILDINQLKRTIENGVKQQVWVYYDIASDFAFDHESPPALWQISEEARLFLPEEAGRLNLRIKGKWQPTGPVLGEEEEDDIPDIPDIDVDTDKPLKLSGDGVPSQAFQQILDKCQENEATAINRLELSFHGFEKSRANDLRAIGLAIPQMGHSQALGIVLELIVEFGEDRSENFKLEFKGGWGLYKRLKQVTDGLAGDGSQVNVNFRLIIPFEAGLAIDSAGLGQMRDILQQMGMGSIHLTVYPEYA